MYARTPFCMLNRDFDMRMARLVAIMVSYNEPYLFGIMQKQTEMV